MSDFTQRRLHLLRALTSLPLPSDGNGERMREFMTQRQRLMEDLQVLDKEAPPQNTQAGQEQDEVEHYLKLSLEQNEQIVQLLQGHESNLENELAQLNRARTKIKQRQHGGALGQRLNTKI
ncbi:MAG: hypothetical protein QGI45_02455 [Myxococcota bacterium]|jgi:hypothetical protein|nr:hypothetical protein [Myxococcota bacterium]